ncbi:hypothetical protein AB0L82_36040 [Nocardia sp. NPDC052001]|uniref:hypothetical protein n=1 Tax=Nocardia sp. NPDC052001 TaxID=3154853 RepID=UPI0034287E9C
MSYSGPAWTEFAKGERLRVRRVFNPAHPVSGNHRAEWFGRILRDVSEHGFWLAREDTGSRTFHAWDPGPTCHQTVTTAPPR